MDDEPLVRWSLTMGLRRAGFAADSAADPAEALQIAARQPSLEVVLLDAGLWGADPFVLLEEIRTLAPRCRFLILAVEGQALRLAPWDGVGVIRKPFDLPAVVRVVQDAVACAGHRPGPCRQAREAGGADPARDDDPPFRPAADRQRPR
jgi:DNA-binding NtrC family response regulator